MPIKKLRSPILISQFSSLNRRAILFSPSSKKILRSNKVIEGKIELDT